MAWGRALPLLGLAILLGGAALEAAPDCRALHDRRDQLATQAMQAEIALVLATRRRLCPGVEGQAERANANAGTTAPDTPAPVLDYGAYLRCRAQAEGLLRRTHRVLYRNRRQFIFYTAEGAQRAREADDLDRRLGAICAPSPGPPSP